ncbi:hypothetical protein [Sinorhizobium medicae]|uniref:hypothetical protein n=1 Tax=Sinorhizobium medicae TaxID=110321 RepID=UPI00138FB4C9|nr:hypothetical protein [Sinorhizobium medicae]
MFVDDFVAKPEFPSDVLNKLVNCFGKSDIFRFGPWARSRRIVPIIIIIIIIGPGDATSSS